MLHVRCLLLGTVSPCTGFPNAGHAFSTGERNNRLLSCVEFPQVLASSILQIVTGDWRVIHDNELRVINDSPVTICIIHYQYSVVDMTAMSFCPPYSYSCWVNPLINMNIIIYIFVVFITMHYLIAMT